MTRLKVKIIYPKRFDLGKEIEFALGTRNQTRIFGVISCNMGFFY